MAYVKFGRFVLGALVSSWLVAACGDAGGTGQPDTGEGSGGTPSGDGPGPDDGSTGGSGPIAGAPGTGGETPVGPTQLSAIHQEGAFWVNEEGEKVRLRGANLGNWLILEFWMMAQAMNDGGANINDQCTLEGVLTERFGFAEKERLMEVFRDNWMQERDFDLLKAAGMNVIRIPFIYHLLEDEQNPKTLRADAWKYLDWAVEQAEKRGMYTILDLHGAVGSQGWEHHSGCAGKNEFWGSATYRDRTKWLWEEIGKHYRGRSAVAGYGLLNEPWGTTAANLAAVSYELFDALRAVDPDHVIILPGHNSGGIDSYGNPADFGRTNAAFEMHFYPGFWGWRENDDPVDVHANWLHCSIAGTGEVCSWNDRITGLATPFLVGEFQPWTELAASGGVMTRKTYDIYNEYGWAATNWAYKLVTSGGSNGNPANGWHWGMVTNKNGSGFGAIDVGSASIEQIEAWFAAFGQQELVLHPGIEQWMNYEAAVGERIEAEIFAEHDGVRMEPTTDEGGGFNASNISPGDTMSYQLDVPTAGTYQVEFRVAALNAGGGFTLHTETGDLPVVVPDTNGWQTWSTVGATVTLGAGRQTFEIESTGGEYNLNWWRLTPQ